jgi:hypothetical protein
MSKTKFNPDLLKEELNRFKMINEYSFYKESNSDNPSDDLLIGSTTLDEVDEDPNDAASKVASELGIPPEDNAEATPEGPVDIPNPGNTEEPPTPPTEPAMPAMPEEDVEEIDITSLVNSTDEAKNAAAEASQNTQMLMQKLSDLESRIASMDAINGKIEGLEKEIIKRNPTNVEKLEMQSLNSGPYTQKLSDYWADKHGAYDVMGNDEKQEYILTKDDVDADYSDNDIRKSFSVSPDDFEEEDI